MQNYQRQFLDFALATGALRFGEFRLKSGRLSPYFFDAGLFNTGSRIAILGGFYARALVDAGVDFDMVFGPAYKGVPLAITTTIALAAEHDRDVPYAFNRKEIKDHGEGGQIVGAPLQGRVLIVDDVISAGLSVDESMQLIEAATAQPAAVAIALDRQELGNDGRSAVTEVSERYGIPVISIVTLNDLIAYLENQPEASGHLQTLRTYRHSYGA